MSRSLLRRTPRDLASFSLFLALVFLAGAASAQSAKPQYQACGVFGPLQSNPAQFCTAQLTGGAQPDGRNCPRTFDSSFGLNFDDDLHVRWYNRIWTGKCVGFRPWHGCTGAHGGWTETVTRISARVPEAERARARAELWAIGRMIGFEWAKRNNVRKISSADLSRWAPLFNAEPDPWHAMRALCGKASTKLGPKVGKG